MSEDNPLNPYGWSQRYSAAIDRYQEAKSMAPINAMRQAHIRKMELARELRDGKLSQDDHDMAVLELDENVKVTTAESEVESEPDLSASQIDAMRRRVIEDMRDRAEAARAKAAAKAEAEVEAEAESGNSAEKKLTSDPDVIFEDDEVKEEAAIESSDEKLEADFETGEAAPAPGKKGRVRG